eukprot:XP_001705901.1 Hypothetical protein GL50803_1132 [Giardia lamblia ATCC 50803]
MATQLGHWSSTTRHHLGLKNCQSLDGISRLLKKSQWGGRRCLERGSESLRPLIKIIANSCGSRTTLDLFYSLCINASFLLVNPLIHHIHSSRPNSICSPHKHTVQSLWAITLNGNLNVHIIICHYSFNNNSISSQ